MDLAMGLGNPDPDLGGAVSHAWVHLMSGQVLHPNGGRIVNG